MSNLLHLNLAQYLLAVLWSCSPVNFTSMSSNRSLFHHCSVCESVSDWQGLGVILFCLRAILTSPSYFLTIHFTMFYLCVQQMVELLLNLENTMLLPQDHFGSAVGQIVSFPYPLGGKLENSGT